MHAVRAEIADGGEPAVALNAMIQNEMAYVASDKKH